VVYRTCLENRSAARHREFESHPLRMRRDRLYKRGNQTYFRVNKAFNIKPSVEFIDGTYELIFSVQNEMTPTGLLVIFSIVSKNTQAPYFIGRWDQLQEVVDVDIENTDSKSVRAFRSSKNGFRGHRPQRISKDTRTFLVDIAIPSGSIFRGALTFNIGWGVEMPETLTVVDFVETDVRKNTFWARVKNFFKVQI
jgi:hypothetical protein